MQILSTIFFVGNETLTFDGSKTGMKFRGEVQDVQFKNLKIQKEMPINVLLNF
jgi:hypothetical protein